MDTTQAVQRSLLKVVVVVVVVVDVAVNDRLNEKRERGRYGEERRTKRNKKGEGTYMATMFQLLITVHRVCLLVHDDTTRMN